MSRALYIYSHEFFPKRGGIGTYCQEFAKAAAESRQAVHVVVPDYAELENKADSSYQLIRYKNRGTLNPRSIWRTSRILQHHLHTTTNCVHLLAEPGPVLALGLLSKKQHSNSIILTLHGSELARWGSHPISRFLACRAFQKADSIITVSNPIRELFKQYYPDFSGKVHTVHSAATSYFLAAGLSNPKPAVVKRGDTVNLLSVGRIHPRKNYEDLIIAISELKKRNSAAVKLTIAGAQSKPDYLEQLKAQAEELGVEVEWVLNSTNAELVNCYRRADIFALVSRQKKKSIEGYGLVFLEAGSFGLPCIAYAHGGMIDAIADAKTGFLVETGNTHKLAAAIEKLADSPDLRARLGQANQERTQSRRWVDVVTQTMATLPDAGDKIPRSAPS